MSDTLAALYLRVSTLDQHPETQLHDLRQMAAQRGLEIAGVYEDRITGARASRPGLDRLMSDARQGKFQVLAVWSCDRLARSVRHFLETLDELNRLGWSSSASGSTSHSFGEVSIRPECQRKLFVTSPLQETSRRRKI